MSICTNCNGKGYNTVYKGEGGYTDFGPMKYIETTPMGIHKIPCSKCQAKEDKELEKETTGQTVYEQLQEIMSDVDRTEEANDTGRTALNEIVRLLDNAIIPKK